MAKTDKDPIRKLSALTAKALRRGEKLERTLTKLAAHSGPGSATEDFLKTVQGGLKAIRKTAKAMEHSASAGTKKAAKSKKGAKTAAKPKAAPKKPAPADISPPAEVNSQS